MREPRRATGDGTQHSKSAGAAMSLEQLLALWRRHLMGKPRDVGQEEDDCGVSAGGGCQ